MSPYPPEVETRLIQSFTSPYFTPVFPDPTTEQEEDKQNRIRQERADERTKLRDAVAEYRSLDDFPNDIRGILQNAEDALAKETVAA